MSNITNANYADSDHSMIRVDFDGKTLNVPAAPGNRHYDEIVKQGIAPADYEPPPMPTVIPFRVFAARFTEAERQALGRVAYSTDPATGEPKYPNVIDKIAMKSDVNLKSDALGAFMDVLVAEATLDAARKTEILDPEWSP